jgi:UDP-glucose 4-epimerase
MNDKALDPLDAYRLVNVQGTQSLARQAAVAGVRRFVFVSSIKVNGEKTELGHPFVADDTPAPMDPYGVSKFEAEQALMLLGKQTGMEIVIVRPPLVYGPGVKANFQTMLRWVALGIPLPLGGIKNARSMVALGNLVDLLILCIDHPEAAGQIFLVSDGEDVSTSELLRRSAQAMQKTIYLPSVSDGLIYFFADIFGRRAMAERLCGSLQVDIQKTRDLLNWQPPLSLSQALELTVAKSAS